MVERLLYKPTILSGARAQLTLLLLVGALAIVAAWFYRHDHELIPKDRIHIVEIDPSSGVRVRPVMIDHKIRRTESFSQIMADLHPYAAINGTLFGDTMNPLGDILAGGRLINRGIYTNAIAITKTGKIDFIRRKGGAFHWANYDAGLAAGPRLVDGGKIILDPIADGFSNMSTTLPASRSGVALTRTGKLLLVVVFEPISLTRFAKLMLDIGAVDAMNLDGGPACALYHRGRVLVNPTLPMTNLLVVYKASRQPN